MKKKWAIGFSVLTILIACVFLWEENSREIHLQLGIFVGSNWTAGSTDTYQIVDQVIEEFEEEYPDVKVFYETGIIRSDYSEWYAQELLEGEDLDVVMILSEDFERLVSLGTVKELTELIEEDEEFDESYYYQSALETGEMNGAQFALPYEVVPDVMVVNKTLLEKEGFEIPESDWTWENLLEIAEGVTKDSDGDGNLDQFAVYQYEWEDAVYSNGAKVFNAHGSESYMASSEIQESIEFTKKLNLLNNGYNVTQSDFDSGKVAFMPMSFAEYRTYKTYPYKVNSFLEFEWDCIPMPAGPSGGNCSQVDALLLGISENTNHEKLAWELLKLFAYDNRTQMDVLRYSQGASGIKAVTNSNEAEYILQKDMSDEEVKIDMQILDTVIENGIVVPKFSKYEEAMVLMDNQVRNIINDDMSIENTLKILEREMDEFLNEYTAEE